jgi:hypothetical protein
MAVENFLHHFTRYVRSIGFGLSCFDWCETEIRREEAIELDYRILNRIFLD